MKKNIFDIFKKMNADDAVNGTANLGISNTLVSAQKVKLGGHITMGVAESVIMDVVLKQDKIILLLSIDRAEYERLEKSPD